MNTEVHRPIVINNLYYEKGYGARTLTKEFPAKTWKKICTKFLKMIEGN